MPRKRAPASILTIRTVRGTIHLQSQEEPDTLTLLLPHEGEQTFYRDIDGVYRIFPPRKTKPKPAGKRPIVKGKQERRA
jgi:hypothetical protein